MMRYFFDPVDNFFFRSAVPFEAGGETTTIASTFPPLPSVYAGALRPFLANPANGARQLKIGLNGLCLDNQFHFPQPLDLYLAHPPQLNPMSLVKAPLSSYPLPFMPTVSSSVEKSKKTYHWYLPASELQRYLQGEASIQAVDIGADYLLAENKLGIAIDPTTGSAKDEMIYQLTYQRPHNGLQLACEAQGVSVPSQALVPLGGEGKLAKLTSQEAISEISAPQSESDTRFFKLYLATPAIFKNGWLPGWIDPLTYRGTFIHKKHRIRIKLLSACVGRPVPCGGFGTDPDDGKRRPREMRYAVPAGSVYYFSTQDSLSDAISLLHQKCISDYREGLGFPDIYYDRSRYCDRGFGYALVGLLTPEQLQEVSP